MNQSRLLSVPAQGCPKRGGVVGPCPGLPQARRTGGLVRRTPHLAVPRDVVDDPVGVEYRVEEDDDVLANEAHFLGLFRRETVREGRCHLRRGVLLVVHAPVDPYDRFPSLREAARFVLSDPGAGELFGGALPIAKASEVALTGDEEEQDRLPLRAPADLLDLDPIGGFGECVEVRLHLVVVRKLVVGARGKAEGLSGGGNLRCRRGRSEQ
jgi:hypothetical protein